MCGILGFISPQKNIDNNELIKRGVIARDSLYHRGPDAKGELFLNDCGLFLGHRRLSILDLSEYGNQPMESSCGRFILVFNGEIYNFKELKNNLNLKGFSINWKSNSDTEVLIESIAKIGLEETLNSARGMFAFAFWDKIEKKLIIARDRVGQKPIYYGYLNNKFGFAFSSELKALKILSNNNFNLCNNSLSLFLKFGYISSPNSIYEGIYKLPPSSYLVINNDCSFSEPKLWWNFKEIAEINSKKSNTLSDLNLPSNLEAILFKAVEEQMISDVPIGAFLSGGIDSSLIVCIMQALSKKPIKTFTIGFEETEFNEADQALAIAKHIGTDHHNFILRSKDSLEIIPRLSDIYDEPFADSSQIPTTLLCKITSNNVKVSLSGDAGDELFGGYSRYIIANSIWKKIKHLPLEFRMIIKYIFSNVPISFWNNIYNILGTFLPRKFRITNPGNKIFKISYMINAFSPENLYFLIVSQWLEELPLIKNYEIKSIINQPKDWPKLDHFTERMMAIDILTYLPDDILVKIDRAAMASSLETRIPFLDERIIDFSTMVNLHEKINNSGGKIILKKILSKYIPKNLFDRPKKGFGVPIEYWLRTSLRDWTENLLSKDSLSSSGLLDSKPIRELWKKHLNGENHQAALWNVLMFQDWYLKNK